MEKNKKLVIGLWLFLAFVSTTIFIHIFYIDRVLEFLASVPALKIQKPDNAYFYSETGAYKQPLILFQLMLTLSLAVYVSWVKGRVNAPAVRVTSLFSKLLVAFYLFLGFLSILMSSGFGGMVG